MENESRFARMWRPISDKIQDQVWYQQGKVKWDELDAKTRMAIKYGSLTVLTLGLAILVVNSAMSVSRQKKDLNDKVALIQKIQAAQDEMRKLKEVTSLAAGGSSPGSWNSYFENQATTSGIDATTLTVSAEKAVSGGAKKEESRHIETIIEVAAKKINIRHLVGFVFNIENGGRTAKVRRLQVDTQPDESGYLDVTVVVSAFTLKPDGG